MRGGTDVIPAPLRVAPAPLRVAPAPLALTSFFSMLESDGIRWSLLRPASSVASPEGDVDVLVEPESIDHAEDALRATGFVLMPLPRPDVHGCLYDAELGRFVWVHVQGALNLAGAELPAAQILAQVHQDDRLRLPSDDWLLWILLLRALVDKGELAPRHRDIVTELARGWGGGPPELVGLAQRRGVETGRAVSAASRGDWSELMRCSVHRGDPPPTGFRRWRQRLARLGDLSRLYEGRGVSVAVIGPDGAGKSRLTAALAQRLPLASRVQYMGLTGGRMPLADALRVPGLVFAARVLLIWLRYARGLRQIMRGGIAVFDRYTLDGTVPPGMRLSLIGRISRRLQVHVCPLPDLVLLLDASGETLHARSGEYTPEKLESWRRTFALLEGRVEVLEKIDAERSFDEVQADALARVWRRYAELRAR